MAHIGKEKDRIELTVKYIRTVEYTTHYTYYGEKHYIHIFTTEDGDKIVWKTNRYLMTGDKHNSNDWVYINEGATIRIKATVKEHGEYKGEAQTIVNRLTIVELIENGKSPAEIEAERQTQKDAQIQAQLNSIKDGDEIVVMDYRQYKKHYSDCETVIDSYDAESREVSVIVRNGRMKNSGVRGKHFYTYLIEIDGEETNFKAVSADNAMKQAKNLYKDATSFELVGARS